MKLKPESEGTQVNNQEDTHANPEQPGNTININTYHITQAGAVGPNAQAHDNTFNQGASRLLADVIRGFRDLGGLTRWYFLALKRYANFGGRARRKEFWMFVLINFVVGMLIGFLSSFAGRITDHQEIGLALSLLYSLATLVPGLAVTVRRLHDTNRSAWWLLINLVPVVGPLALLVILLSDTARSDNRYGPNPKANVEATRMSWRTVMAAALVMLTVTVPLVLLSPGNGQPTGLPPFGPSHLAPPFIMFRGDGGRPGDGSLRSPSEADIAGAKRDLARHPKDPRLLNDLGALLDTYGDTARGHALLAEAHSLKPDDPDIGYNYGRSLFQLGKIDEADKQADHLITENSNSAEARLLKASVAIEKREYKTAEDQVAKVLKKESETPNSGTGGVVNKDKVMQILKSIQIVALCIRGVVDLAKGRTQQGRDAFEAAVSLGNDPTALYNTGVAYQQLGEPAKAESYYQNAIAVNPNLAEAHYNLGSLMLARHDLSGAQRELSKVVDLKPELRKPIEKALRDANKPPGIVAAFIAMTERVRSFQSSDSPLSHGKNRPDIDIPAPIPQLLQPTITQHYVCRPYHLGIAKMLTPTAKDYENLANRITSINMDRDNMIRIKQEIDSYSFTTRYLSDKYGNLLNEYNTAVASYNSKAYQLNREIEQYSNKKERFEAYLKRNCVPQR